MTDRITLLKRLKEAEEALHQLMIGKSAVSLSRGDAGGNSRSYQYAQADNAALKLSDWVHGRQFGRGTAPAEFISAEPVIWQKGEGGADHAVWSVNFTQRLAVGADPFDEPDAPRLKEFWLGIFPDVGAGHEQDYALIAKGE